MERDPADTLALRAHPAGRRVERAVAAATVELLPASRSLVVAVAGPDEPELRRAHAWLAANPLTAAETADKIGVPVTDSELVGWVSEWSVTASDWGGVTRTYVLATAQPAEIATDLAEWLQDALANSGVANPVPACPDHPHPMVPVVHEGAAWWSCPKDGLVRPWRLPRRHDLRP